jgi:hypothetical protein
LCTIGGLAEGRRGFVWVESARLALIAVGALLAGAGVAPTGALVAVGCATAAAWLWWSARPLPYPALA